jgi:hypothetical protein
MTDRTPRANFPARIWALLLDVADRNPKEGFGLFEDGNGDPMQDDADAALAWLTRAAAALATQQQGEGA